MMRTPNVHVFASQGRRLSLMPMQLELEEEDTKVSLLLSLLILFIAEKSEKFLTALGHATLNIVYVSSSSSQLGFTPSL